MSFQPPPTANQLRPSLVVLMVPFQSGAICWVRSVDEICTFMLFGSSWRMRLCDEVEVATINREPSCVRPALTIAGMDSEVRFHWFVYWKRCNDSSCWFTRYTADRSAS